MNQHVTSVSPCKTAVMVCAAMVCAAVSQDPARFLDQEITPFATPRQLMGGAPPARWRLFARRRWFARLAEWVTREVTQQERFAVALSCLELGRAR